MSKTVEARKYLRETIESRSNVIRERMRIISILRDYPDVRANVLRSREYQVPDYPTVEGLTSYRDDLMAYASEPVRSYGNCYYSCCGLEDAEGYRKDNAREHAKLLTTCIRVLKWQKETR
jgi:hypothetical protein